MWLSTRWVIEYYTRLSTLQICPIQGGRGTLEFFLLLFRFVVPWDTCRSLDMFLMSIWRYVNSFLSHLWENLSPPCLSSHKALQPILALVSILHWPPCAVCFHSAGTSLFLLYGHYKICDHHSFMFTLWSSSNIFVSVDHEQASKARLSTERSVK